MNKVKKILLLGGGHANIQVLHRLARSDRSRFELTLVSDVASTPYSGMIPSYMANVYSKDELCFDLRNICSRFGFEFIEDRAVHIDGIKNSVRTGLGRTIHYDVCSIDIGIQPSAIPMSPSSLTNLSAGHVIYLKPISKLIQEWERILNETVSMAPRNIAVVGGGAAAFEIAVACRRRFSNSNCKIKMITGSHELLFGQNERTKRLARQSLHHLEIELIEGQRVQEIDTECLVLSDGTSFESQICFVATTAAAPAVLRDSNLPINNGGFVRVRDDLRVHGFENLFAAGDCCHFESRPLPKAGVFAVRQGPVLSKNILAAISGSTRFSPYRPQKRFLTILVSGESEAIASYGDISLQGRLAWRLKNQIDLRFMRRFR